MRKQPTSLDKWAAAFAATILIAAGAARAEPVIIHLSNGDRITGTITSEDGRELVILSGSLGRLTIPLVQITKREPVGTEQKRTEKTNEPAVPAQPAKTEAAVPTPQPPPNTAAAVTPPAPKPEEKKKKPQPAAGPKRWNTDLQVGANLRYSTAASEEYLVIAKTTYGKNRFRQIFDYNFTYGKTEKQLSANRMTGSAKTEYDISKRGYIFDLLGTGYDQVRGIEAQYEFGPGLGYQLINSTKHNLILSGEAGFSYTDELRNIAAGGEDKQTYAARLAGILSWKVYDKLTLNGRVEFFPDFEKPTEYKIRSEMTLSYPLLRNTSLNLLVLDLYDTAPGLGIVNNDLQIRSTVGLRF